MFTFEEMDNFYRNQEYWEEAKRNAPPAPEPEYMGLRECDCED